LKWETLNESEKKSFNNNFPEVGQEIVDSLDIGTRDGNE
jgi:hypothetical protein